MTREFPDRCPVCRHEMDVGDLVCSSCGYSLYVCCASCGYPTHLHHNYCPACGRPLGTDGPTPTYGELQATVTQNQAELLKYAQDLTKLYISHRKLEQYVPTGLLEKVLLTDEPTVGERRYMTVLFSDVVGFTTLSANRDPEEVFWLMNNCFRLLVEQVYKYGGSVDKFIGDGMMALFGAPISYGNDAERALRAALGMQTAMGEFNEQFRSKLASPMAIRIGVTSGDVIAGTVGAEGQRSYTVMGSTVNMAARMEAAAGAGAILVNEDVYRQTKHLFNYRVLDPISVKGFEGEVPVYEVASHIGQPRTPRTQALDQLSAFVGRQIEMQQLDRVVHQLGQGVGSVVFIVGGAGLGKTRLMWEWQLRLPPELQLWFGSAYNVPQASYEIWRQTILHGLGLEDAPPEKIRDVLRGLAGDETWLPFLEVLTMGGISRSSSLRALHPEQLKEQIFVAVNRLLRNVTRRGPLVIMLDNLQWFDQLSRELLRSVLKLSASLPINFCLSSRPDAKDLAEILAQANEVLEDYALEIQLPALSEAESAALIRERFGVSNMPASLGHYVLGRGENNPYYLEELVSFVINSEFVERDETGWRISDAAALANLRLPGSLQSLVRAQIDRLAEIDQQILSYAAVVGPTFPASLILFVLGQVPRLANVPNQLANLVRRGILAFDGTNYHFVHNLMHEEMYRGLLSERRRQLHYQVGLALEARLETDSTADVEQLAHHFSAAANSHKAIPYLIEAGQKAWRRFAHETTLAYLSTALTMLPDVPELAHHAPELHKMIGDVGQHIGDYEQALNHYRQALGQTTDSNLRADYMRLVGQIWQRKGDAAQARSWLDRAMSELTNEPGQVNDLVRGRVYADMGLLLMRAGDYQLARRRCEEAIDILVRGEAWTDVAKALNSLGGTYYFQHRWHEASLQVQRAREIQQQINDQMGMAGSLSNLAMLYVIDGQWDNAIATFDETIAMCNDMGALEMTLSNAHNNIAFIYLHRGQLDLAEDHLQQSLEIKHRVGSTLEVPQTLNNLGLSRLMRGELVEAEAYVVESANLARQHERHMPLIEALSYLAEIKLAGDEVDRALEACQEAISLAHNHGAKVNEGNALRILAQIQLSRGEIRPAKESALTGLRLLQEVSHIYEEARTQLVVAEIALKENDLRAFDQALNTARPVLEQLGASPALEWLNTLQQFPVNLADGSPGSDH
jgi:class 3 adenylate cyclase/predicted ATPase